LLVTSGIIGLLISIVLPAVNSVREGARQVQCRNNLKQIGIALHCYHDAWQTLPAAWQWVAGSSHAYGWAASLLPLLEQQALYENVDRGVVLSDPRNDRARESTPGLFLCPSDIVEPVFPLYAEDQPASLVELPTAGYLAVFGTFEADDVLPPPYGDGPFPGARGVRFAELVRGLSNTVAVGERTMARVPSTWLGIDFRGEDAACRIVGNAETGPNRSGVDECEFGSRHPDHAYFLWADGHVKSIPATVDSAVYRRMAQRAVCN
jgi:prepilin-type processing-associated H-X9-DG protein